MRHWPASFKGDTVVGVGPATDMPVFGKAEKLPIVATPAGLAARVDAAMWPAGKTDELPVFGNVEILPQKKTLATLGPPWAPKAGAGTDAGTDNCDSTDSSGFTFKGPWVALTAGTVSKEAQLLSSLEPAGCMTD